MGVNAQSQANKDWDAWANEPRVEEPIRDITNCPNGDSIPKDDPKCNLEPEKPTEAPKQPKNEESVSVCK